MLDKYEQDPRITMIAGFNNEEITPGVPYDYFFASTFFNELFQLLHIELVF